MTQHYTLELRIDGHTVLMSEVTVTSSVGTYYSVLTATVDALVSEKASIQLLRNDTVVFDGFVFSVKKIEPRKTSIVAHSNDARLSLSFVPPSDNAESARSFSELCADWSAEYGVPISFPEEVDLTFCDVISRGNESPGDVIRDLARKMGHDVIPGVEIIPSPKPISDKASIEITTADIIGEVDIEKGTLPAHASQIEIHGGCAGQSSSSGGSSGGSSGANSGADNDNLTARVENCPPSIIFYPSSDWNLSASGCNSLKNYFEHPLVTESKNVYEHGWNTVALNKAAVASTVEITVNGRRVSGDVDGKFVELYVGHVPATVVVVYRPVAYKAILDVDHNDFYDVTAYFRRKDYHFRGKVEKCLSDDGNNKTGEVINPDNDEPGSFSITKENCATYVIRSSFKLPNREYRLHTSDGFGYGLDTTHLDVEYTTKTKGVTPFVYDDKKRYVSLPDGATQLLDTRGNIIPIRPTTINGVQCSELYDDEAPSTVVYRDKTYVRRLEAYNFKNTGQPVTLIGPLGIQQTFSCVTGDNTHYLQSTCSLPLQVRINVGELYGGSISDIIGATVTIGDNSYTVDAAGFIDASFAENGSYLIQSNDFSFKKNYYCNVEVPQ